MLSIQLFSHHGGYPGGDTCFESTLHDLCQKIRQGVRACFSRSTDTAREERLNYLMRCSTESEQTCSLSVDRCPPLVDIVEGILISVRLTQSGGEVVFEHTMFLQQVVHVGPANLGNSAGFFDVSPGEVHELQQIGLFHIR